MPKITIEMIPHSQQRYNTVGDWKYDDEGNIDIKISEMSSGESFYLIAIHELTEAALCRILGPSVKKVDSWDMSHPESDEPGSVPGCPYYSQHQMAEIVERLICQYLHIPWYEHEINVAEASTTDGTIKP